MMTLQKSTWRWGGRLLVFAAWSAALVMTIWMALRFYPGDRWLPVRLANYFTPWLLLAFGPALLAALLGRQWRLIILLSILFLIFGWPYLGQFLPRPAPVGAVGQGHHLKVMTFNTHYSNYDGTATGALIKAESPDVIALQEVNLSLAGYLLHDLGETYPYQLGNYRRGVGVVLLSRYPLQPYPLPEGVAAYYTFAAIAETPAGPILIWNVHPRVALQQYLWVLQGQTLAAVADEIAELDIPVIVMGDFNTTDQTETYRLLANSLTDVHRAVGRGLGLTFPRPESLPRSRHYLEALPPLGPFVRIDMVLVSDHFIPQESRVLSDVALSDHLPVVATLRLSER